MPSAKRRTTSKSGASAKSRKTATSQRKKNFSPTVPASFEETFGKPENPEVRHYKALKSKAQLRLAEIEATPVPTLALLRSRHKQRLARLKAYIQEIEEVIQHKQLP